MASRQVTLLVKGYLSGRLNFQYPNPFSLARENFILEQIETEEMAKIIEQKLAVESQLISLSPATAKEIYTQINQNIINTYVRLRLPYIAKKDNINTTGKLSEEEKDYFRKILKEKKEQLDKAKNK